MGFRYSNLYRRINSADAVSSFCNGITVLKKFLDDISVFAFFFTSFACHGVASAPEFNRIDNQSICQIAYTIYRNDIERQVNKLIDKFISIRFQLNSLLCNPKEPILWTEKSTAPLHSCSQFQVELFHNFFFLFTVFCEIKSQYLYILIKI